MNSAYKHLDSKLRIGELTIAQWAGIVAGVLGALMWGMYVSPFSDELTLLSAVYIGGVPVTLVVLASTTDFDLLLIARASVRWRRAEGRHLPGPGDRARGYRVDAERDTARAASANGHLGELDLAVLWDS